MNTRHRLLAVLVACLLAGGLLSACRGDKTAAGAGADDAGALPHPDAGSGSVTGMPNPGESTPDPGHPLANADTPPDPDTASDPVEDTGNATMPDQSADAAVAVLRQYYAAINARDYSTAYAQWADAGAASGQSAQQFAAGFGATAGVSVQIGTPGAIDAGAGQRHIDIPVTVEARQADASVRRYEGRYVLKMTVVDGASPEQRSWRIASANLRESAQ